MRKLYCDHCEKEITDRYLFVTVDFPTNTIKKEFCCENCYSKFMEFKWYLKEDGHIKVTLNWPHVYQAG